MQRNKQTFCKRKHKESGRQFKVIFKGTRRDFLFKNCQIKKNSFRFLKYLKDKDETRDIVVEVED